MSLHASNRSWRCLPSAGSNGQMHWTSRSSPACPVEQISLPSRGGGAGRSSFPELAPKPAPISNRGDAAAANLLAELLQESAGVPQIAGAESICELIVDRCENL